MLKFPSQYYSALICSFSLLFFAKPLTAAESGLPVNTETQSRISVTSAQPEFIIKLTSNPTTGYIWQLREYDKSKISPLTHRYVAPTTKLMGASGYELWKFRAKPAAFAEPHVTSIKFDYVRPWEPENVAKQAEYIVTSN